ncbi:hypothetical protein [Demequina pelophila]|uniref:hypothetical protein n=1 Tax=Demequina pelophila TaxID=1638984 RepID=UPI000784C2C8|nr:hypothetical protein [Demequina pelophila]
MTEPNTADFEARLAALEAENLRLRAALDDQATRPALGVTATHPAAASSTGSHRGRAFLAIALIVLATVIAPLATVAAFAVREASDTEAFVRTLAPLASDPAVQALVVDEATQAIDAALDTDALVDDLLTSVFDEDTSPRLANASELLGPLLADQARVAIRSALTAVVESRAFATTWEEALRLTHRQIVAVMEADADGALAIDDAGTVAIQLGPVIERLRPALVDAGFTLAAAIPEVDASITVAQVPSVAKARLGYSILTTVGTVLPWVALTLLVLGVALHPRRARALAVAGTLLLIVGLTLGGLIAVGGSVIATLLATEVPADATSAIYGTLTGETAAVMLAYAALGALFILAGALFGGSSAAAATVRRAGASAIARGTAALDRRGWRPEGVAMVLRRLPWLLWCWLALVLVVLAATMPPLTVLDVLIGTLVLGAAGTAYLVLQGPRDAA